MTDTLSHRYVAVTLQCDRHGDHTFSLLGGWNDRDRAFLRDRKAVTKEAVIDHLRTICEDTDRD